MVLNSLNNKMKKHLVIILFLARSVLSAQYTETINSNRPGNSDSAFSVGKDVIQVESGFVINNGYVGEIDLSETNSDFRIRYGNLLENLELDFNINLKFYNNDGFFFRDWNKTSLSLKYLVFDPFKNDKWYKENLYSWKANRKFRAIQLIPAISFRSEFRINNTDIQKNLIKSSALNYFLFDKKLVNNIIARSINSTLGNIILNNDEIFQGIFKIILQNHFSPRWVLINNFDFVYIGNRYFTEYSHSTTLTHNFNNPKISSFIEHNYFFNNLYNVNQLSFGLAFLLNKNLQIDINGGFNNKLSLANYHFGSGLSFRIDRHNELRYQKNALNRSRVKEFKDLEKIKQKQLKTEKRNLRKSNKRSRKKFLIF